MYPLCSCYHVSYQEQVSTKVINRSILRSGEIEFITKNGAHYRIQIENMNQYVIEGTGDLKKPGKGQRKIFSGRVPLDSIDTVILSEYSATKSMLTNSSALLIIWMAAQSMKGPEPPVVNFAYPPLPFGSSCPFIYSYANGKNILEGEAFGTSLGKGLEKESGIILSTLSGISDDPKILITNERPETHYINRVRMYAVKHSSMSEIVLDPENNSWPVTRSQTPLWAVDHSNRVITNLIRESDSIYWESDLANISSTSSLQDQIEVIFPNEGDTEVFSLIVSAINSNLITSVYNTVFAFLGEDALPFFHQLENDTYLISLLKDWIKRCSLKAWVWDNEKWIYIGAIEPEANAVSFKRLLRFSIPDLDSDIIKIKLCSLPDVWKIDAVTLDRSAFTPIRKHELYLKSMTGPNHSATLSNIMDADDHYAIIFPGDTLFIEFESLKEKFTKPLTCMVTVQGYLHEWFPHQDKVTVFNQFNNLPIGANRVTMLSHLMQFPKLLLPPIYADWKKRKGNLNRSTNNVLN
jgi:hypothetical protein